MKELRSATCQVSVEADIQHNLKWILKQIEQAADQKADVVHFSECALSGYAGVDIPDIASLDWQELVHATRQVLDAARKHRTWVLLGSTHRLQGRHKPHNCVYVINPKGHIVSRYDKRFCTGQRGKPTHDLCHYSPGNHSSTFRVRGILCGVLICYDYRFPELYRTYLKQGVKVIFQSFHNARSTVVEDETYNIWKTIVPATMACRAAENHFWISANNSTTRPSRWGSFSVRPDGAILQQLPLHRPGVLITDMPLNRSLFDAAAPWRDRAMQGQLHSGKLVRDARSEDLTCL
ncbi:MAG: carbon-nitrogen hydrolase family protein [Planctomycetota bacterium]|nr:carbon-nitrogen hydrolase family protein [Planctomycetota bacterium]